MLRALIRKTLFPKVFSGSAAIQPKISTPLSPIPHAILLIPIDNQIVTSLCSNSHGDGKGYG